MVPPCPGPIAWAAWPRCQCPGLGRRSPPTVMRVQVGIDTAVGAKHHVCVKETTLDGQVRLTPFHVPPTLAGLRRLGEELAPYPGVVAVAEPTSMTWLGLSVAPGEAGINLSLVGSRHAARWREAISGKHKPDLIDADMLATADEVFSLSPLNPPQESQLALRRALVRGGKLVIDSNRAPRRQLTSLARWAFPMRGPQSQGPGRPRSRS
ncbi:MAG: transposase [Ornithinibacter sp.]